MAPPPFPAISELFYLYTFSLFHSFTSSLPPRTLRLCVKLVFSSLFPQKNKIAASRYDRRRIISTLQSCNPQPAANPPSATNLARPSRCSPLGPIHPRADPEKLAGLAVKWLRLPPTHLG